MAALVRLFSHARLAQSVERKALNLVVVGSSPTVGVFVSLSSKFRTVKRHRWGSNPCGQSPLDFKSNSLTSRTQCLRGICEACIPLRLPELSTLQIAKKQNEPRLSSDCMTGSMCRFIQPSPHCACVTPVSKLCQPSDFRLALAAMISLLPPMHRCRVMWLLQCPHGNLTNKNKNWRTWASIPVPLAC